jgi:hypothetical protein
MATNHTETTATATAPPGVEPRRLIKLGVEVHWRQYVVVRQIDGAPAQPPQHFTPDEFVAWAKKQTQIRRCRALLLRGRTFWLRAADLTRLPTSTSAAENLRLARAMKALTSVSNRWVADRLQMGKTSSVGALLRRFRLQGHTGSAAFRATLSRFTPPWRSLLIAPCASPWARAGARVFRSRGSCG